MIDAVKALPYCVSIHAPHAGRDQQARQRVIAYVAFQSTRPTRGATGNRDESGGECGVSIHAPHAGRD
ncbi:MAG: hypothetical protein WB992_00685, partial [Bryobacteraceae bacterium]